MPYDKLLTTACMKSLYRRRLHQALILLFKCLNGTGPNYIGSLRGEGLNFELPNFNLKFKNSFTYSLTKLWNSLPSQVRLMLMTSKVNCMTVTFLNVSYSA